MPIHRRLAAVACLLLSLPVAAVDVALVQGGRPPSPLPQLAAFAIPALCLAATLTLIAVVARLRTIACVGVVLLLPAAVIALPPVWYASPRHGTACRPSPVPAPTSPFTVMTFNAQFGRADAARVVRLVRAHAVRVLAVQELTPEFDRALTEAGLSRLLPYRNVITRPTAQGTGLYAAAPLTPLTPLRSTLFAGPRAVASVGGTSVRVTAAHPASPDPAWLDSWVGEQAALADELAAADDGMPQIVLGDLNAGDGHASFRRLLRTARLDDATDLAGLSAWPGVTWPEGIPGVPGPGLTRIDHVLLSGQFTARRVSTYPIAGSDHRAVVADLAPAATASCTHPVAVAVAVAGIGGGIGIGIGSTDGDPSDRAVSRR